MSGRKKSRHELKHIVGGAITDFVDLYRLDLVLVHNVDKLDKPTRSTEDLTQQHVSIMSIIKSVVAFAKNHVHKW